MEGNRIESEGERPTETRHQKEKAEKTSVGNVSLKVRPWDFPSGNRLQTPNVVLEILNEAPTRAVRNCLAS